MIEPEIKQPQLQILDILKNFNFFPKVSNALLKSYTERKGYEFLSAGEYTDHLYQYKHDERASVIIPKALAILQRFQYTPSYIGEKERQRIKVENEQLEVEIAKMCAEEGIEYQEVDSMIKNFAEEIGAMLNTSANRMNNMCGTVIATVAQEHFTPELKVKDLEAWYDERAKQLST